MYMKKLDKIRNPVIRKEVKRILRKEKGIYENMDEVLNNGKLKTDMIQTFANTPSNFIINNLNLDLNKSENLLLIMEGNEKDYGKCLDIIHKLQKNSNTKVTWSFHLNGKSQKKKEIMKIFALANYI